VNCPTPSKLKFASRREALTATKHASSKGKAVHRQLRPYHCQCGFWHVTSMTPAALRELRKMRRLAA